MKARILVSLVATLSLLYNTGVFAQGTAFTYQGRLNDGPNPANGIYDLRFTIYDSSGGAGVIAGPLTNSTTPVSNGLFTVTLDFGTGVFSGEDRWLEIGVRSNGIDSFTALTPRQQITATPYAVHAANVDASGLAGTIPSSGLSGTYTGPVTFDNPSNSYSGTFYGSFLGLSFIGGSFAGSFIGNGSGLANLNGSQISSGTIPSSALNNSWRTIGNAGTTPGTHFIGNTDDKPLEFRVNNQRILHIGTNANGSPNLVAGSPANSITGTNTEGSTIAGGGIGLYPNMISASYATIGGGTFHTVAGAWSTIAGGRDNIVQGDHATVAGGQANTIRPSSGHATIAGGGFNMINTNAYFSTVAGGYQNNIGRESYAATIAGGYANNIQVFSPYSSILGGSFNTISDTNYYSVIAGGGGNYVGNAASYAVIAGGDDNAIGDNAYFAVVSGGNDNSIGNNSINTVIGGGSGNGIGVNSSYATIAGGTNNTIGTLSTRATISGGDNNSVGNNSSGGVVAGGDRNRVGNNSTQSIIGGGLQNVVFSNTLAAVGGGFFNQVGGATRTTTTSLFPSQANAVAGGSGNFITEGARGAFIGGGNNNTVLTNGDFAMIPGGEFNDATSYAFAAGRLARANHQGAFVWGDSTFTSIASAAADSVTMRASGGYRLFSNSGATAGVTLAPGGTAWGVISDRNAKKDIAPVDNRAVLEKLATLPITQWHYRWEDQDETPHIGPMAQDFKAAFYPGRDDKSITTQEADGVALAAIQGLNQKLTDELKRRDAENAELKQRLEKLEALLVSRP
jgi:hypothetical protein